jgi:Rrf2 family protein
LTILSNVTNIVTDMPNSRFSIAVHVLSMLSKCCDENMKSEYIAESVNTNAVVIRRLLCELNAAGLVVSQTGASGGTQLSRRPEDITLLEVYRAVSNKEVFNLHRSKPNPRCPVGGNIEEVLSKLQLNVNSAVDRELAKYTMRDVIQSVERMAA